MLAICARLRRVQALNAAGLATLKVDMFAPRRAPNGNYLAHWRQYRHRNPRDAGHIPRLVTQFNLPHMGGAPAMHGARGAGDPA